MPINPEEQAEIEQVIANALRDVSRPNPFSLKAGLRILMTTNVETFERISSASVQLELSDFKEFLQHPEKLAPVSTQNEIDKQETVQFIKKNTLSNLALLDKRTSILPNTTMVRKSIMEGERLKSVVHTSALRNIETSARYVDSLEKRFKEQGFPPEGVEKRVKKAIQSTLELHQAVLEGNISKILECLAVSGVDVNCPDESGNRPIHIAVREGHTETLRLLLTVPDIQLNPVNNNGWTPLHLAARLGFADIVESLLAHPGIQVNAVNSDGWSALHWAAWHGFTEVVTVLLLAPGIQVNIQDKMHTTPLHMAARNGHPDVIAVLIAIAETNVNPIDNEERTPLHLATAYSHEPAAIMLLTSMRIDVNLHDMDGLTPLHWAARNGQVGSTHALLVIHDIDVNAFDHNYMTPLDWAIKNSHPEIVEILGPITKVLPFASENKWWNHPWIKPIVKFFNKNADEAV